MNHDIVIATRNRPEALAVSVPLMLGQSRRPARLIVVDSSDDHEGVRRVVERAAGGSGVEPEVVESERGMTHQRNVGLERVSAPVVFYPDDDALWFEGVAEAVMRVYERDAEGRIGGVCTAESPTPPSGVLEERAPYRMSGRDRFKQRILHTRTKVEKALFPDPFVLHGRSRWKIWPTPAWLEEEDAVLVEWMTGFRMSFRTTVIRASGFEEAFSGYGLNEDVDASFQASRRHLLVGARRAKVFHYRSPQRRSNGRVIGMQHVLNRAYVVCKHASRDSAAVRRLRIYGAYKLMQYLAGCGSAYGRERFLGAWRAWRRIGQLKATPAEELSRRYLELRKECLGTDGEC